MRPIPSAQSHLAPLFAALLLALCPSSLLAQLPDADPSLKFHFEELPPGPIVLFPGIDQPPPEFTSNGMVLQFGPYQTTPGGTGSMEAALIDAAPGGIDSPAALFLTGTSALFDLTGANLLPDETITTVAFPLQGDGSGGPLNIGVNGSLPYVGPAGQLPTNLPDGITAEVIPGELPTMAMLVLTGNLTQLQVGGNIAIGNLLVYAEGAGGNDIPGCTDSTAANYAPDATVDDGTCKYPVTFSVDLGVAGAPDGPIYINGTFDDWCGGCNVMGNINDIWSLTLELPLGIAEYKFATADWGVAEEFQGGESCTMTTGQFTNRFVDVTGPLDLGTVCWNSCDPCPTPCTDVDQDGVCDDQDDCIGTLDQCGVCNGNNDCLGNDIQGCTEVNACNYNPDATVDDGSCNFDSSHLFAMTLTFDQYPVETTWSLVDALGDTVMAGGPYVNGTDNFATHVITASLCAGCYTLTVADAFGDGMCCQWGNGGYTFAIDDQTVASGGEFTDVVTTEICTPGLAGAGCTYETALNYDPSATEDDGSCIFPTCPDPCAADVDEDGICDDVDPCVGIVDDCGVCNGQNACIVPGCTYAGACNFNPDATLDDGSCTFDCDGDCIEDVDQDDICDDIDPCVGVLDECGVCNGNGATLACGCEDFPAGACDCEGNQFDALGICGGTCSGDLDGDGECDDIDCCVGGYDECGVCNGPGAIYDCGCNMMPSGACDCGGSLLDALGVCGGDCPSDLDGDGICDTVDDCVGFMDACGVCNGPGPIFICGCSPLPPGDCDCEGNQLDALGVCGGDCLGDTDGDGLCDSDEVPGCMDGLACNYNPQATDDNGTCVYAEAGYDCLGNCLLDTDDDGICDDNEIPGCMEVEACNFNPQATDNVGCFYPLPSFNCAGECIEDLDEDGVCDGVEVLGCTDDAACNFNPEATEDNGLCLYPVPLYDCLGNCLSDENGDGLCDGQDILGCMDPEACNHNPNATLDDPNLPCLYAVPGYDCQGNGIISGCMEPTACNYDPSATIENPDLPCLDAVPGYDCLGNCIDLDDNGVCDADEVMGCTYPSAENYDPNATEDNGSCEFPIDPESGPPCPDIDGDGQVNVPDLLLLLGQFGEEIDC